MSGEITNLLNDINILLNRKNNIEQLLDLITPKLYVETYNVSLYATDNFYINRIIKQMNDGNNKGIYLYQELDKTVLAYFMDKKELYIINKIINRYYGNKKINSNYSKINSNYSNKNMAWEVGICYYIKSRYNSGGIILTRQSSFRKIKIDVIEDIEKKISVGENYELVFDNSFNAICWGPHFKYMDYGDLEYVKNTNINDFSKMHGYRTTPWVFLEDNGNKKKYAVISVHCPLNKSKRKELINSICSNAKDYSKTYNIILGGDLNMIPDELHNVLYGIEDKQITPQQLIKSKPYGGFLKYTTINIIGDKFPITHKNMDLTKIFEEAIDWILVSNNLKVINYEIGSTDFNTKKNWSDHAPVKITINDS